MTSLQLTLASAAANAADAKWKDHRSDCPRCATAHRKRRIAEMCREGGRLYGDLKLCQADLARQHAADKLPLTGQGTLFTEAEAGGRRQQRRGDTT